MTEWKQARRMMSVILLAMIAAAQAHAQSAAANPIVVESPWARATPGGAKTGAAYMALVNKGSSDDRLLAASTPVADKVQFHEDAEENGVSRMRQLQAVELKPGAKVAFKPGEMHMMLVGLKQPLKEGQTFPMTLEFEKSGKVEVTISVAKVGAMQPRGMGSMHDPDHMHQ